jgi:hypothetical protein
VDRVVLHRTSVNRDAIDDLFANAGEHLIGLA